MRVLIVISSLIITTARVLFAQGEGDTVLTKYFEKTGAKWLMDVSSYVYYYESANKYNATIIFDQKNFSENIRFYKKNSTEGFYRVEGKTPGIDKLVVLLINDENPTLNVIINDQVEYIGPLPKGRKEKMINGDLLDYHFTVCIQVYKAYVEQRVRYEGMAVFRKKNCYKYLLENEFYTKFIYFDADTYLLQGSITQSFKNLTDKQKLIVGSPTQHEKVYEDYIEIEGMLIPKKIISYKNGKFQDSTEFQDIKFNIGFKDDIFYDALNKSKYSF